MDVFWDTMYIANTDVYVCTCMHACLCQSSKNFPLVKQSYRKKTDPSLVVVILCGCYSVAVVSVMAFAKIYLPENLLLHLFE